MENEELKKLEEALPSLKECDLEKGFEIVQGGGRSGMRRLPPKSLLGLDKRNKRRNRGALGEGGTKSSMATTSLHDDVLLDTEEGHK